MSWIAFILIAASIAMHSLWHFLCKSSGKPSMAFFALFSTSLFLTMLPFAICSGLIPQMPPNVIKYAMLGSLFGALGDLGLMLAYKYTDISLAYPTARALPVFMTMLITLLFSCGASLSIYAVIGMLMIFAGCITMAFSNSTGKTLAETLLFLKRGLPGILLAAAATTAYTVTDSFGMHNLQTEFPESNRLLAAGSYSCIREFPVMVFMWLCAIVQSRRNQEKGVLKELAKVYHPYMAGIFAALAYVLILISMNFVDNVSYVQAFRQLSLPFSAFLGLFLLKEKISKLRWSGLLLIMAGLFLSVIK